MTALQLKLNTAEITLKQNVDLENQIKEGLLVLDMLSEFMNFGLMANSGELDKLSGSQQMTKIKKLTDAMDAGTNPKDPYISSRIKLSLDNMLAGDDGQLTDDRASEILFIELLPRGIEIIRGEK